MKLKVINKKRDRVTFDIDRANVGYVNTLRRLFMAEVATMAITNVEFKQNTSSLYDEMIAHRMGLLVLKTDLKSYNVPMPEAAESPATHLTLTLKAAGPKTVYASDIKSKDPKVVPVYPETVIVQLLEGQEVELVATAHLGLGKNHSKWNTGLVTYYYNPKITVNNKSPKLKQFFEKYPPQIRKKDTIDASKINTPDLIDACKGVCDDIVKLEYEQPHTDFVMTIESYGALSPDQIVAEGIKQYDQQLDDFSKLLKQM